MREPARVYCDGRMARFAPWIASVVAILAHVPALFHRLLRDDVTAIRDNVDLRTLSGLARVLQRAPDLPDSDPGASPIVRPLHAAFEWLLWELVRASPQLQHGVSIALHALVAALLVRVLLVHRVDPHVALASTLLFVVHPATANAVAPLSSRAILIGGVALGYAALRAAEAKSARSHALWIGLGALGSALAHEAFLFSAVPLLFLAKRAWLRPAALAAAIATIAAILATQPPIGAPPGTLEAAAGITVHDLFVIVFPPAASSYFTPVALGAPLAIVVLFGIAGLAVVASRRFGGLAGAGLSLIVLACIAQAPAAVRGGVASDRSAWVVLFGLAVTGAAVVERVRERLPPVTKLVSYSPYAFAFVLVPFNWSQVITYRDDASVLGALQAYRPDDPEGKLAGALLWSAQEEHAKAYPVCAEYASTRPLSTRAHLCVGTALLAGGDPEGALVFLRPYAELHSDEERARRALAAALFATNNLAEARAWVVRWRATHPKAADVEAARAELLKRGVR